VAEDLKMSALGKWARGWDWLKRQTSHQAALLWFSNRLAVGVPALVLAVVAVGIFVVCALGQRVSEVAALFRLHLTVETAFFVILSMGLLPREKEGRTLEVLLVCARSRVGLLSQRFLPVCLFVAVTAIGLTTGFYWLTGGGFPWVKMLCIPYALAATAGILTVVLTTYLRNQYAAGMVALLIAVVVATLWLDPMRSFYGVAIERPILRTQPHVGMNRLVLAAVFGFLYDHAVRRLKHVELWMK